jgi:4-hydroxybenzoate polyprenyltransferase
LPFVDFASNILYVMPGIFGYYLASGSYPPLVLVVAGFAHVSAMHIFSAIPDIEFDSKTGIRTTAVFLREKPSMALVLFFWSVLAVLTVILAGFHPLSFLVFIYPAIPLALLVNERLKVEKVYWYLPYVNTSLGGLLFSALVINIAMA